MAVPVPTEGRWVRGSERRSSHAGHRAQLLRSQHRAASWGVPGMPRGLRAPRWCRWQRWGCHHECRSCCWFLRLKRQLNALALQLPPPLGNSLSRLPLLRALMLVTFPEQPRNASAHLFQSNVIRTNASRSYSCRRTREVLRFLTGLILEAPPQGCDAGRGAGPCPRADILTKPSLTGENGNGQSRKAARGGSAGAGTEHVGGCCVLLSPCSQHKGDRGFTAATVHDIPLRPSPGHRGTYVPFRRVTSVLVRRCWGRSGPGGFNEQVKFTRTAAAWLEAAPAAPFPV